jgi:hypothetical protein
MKRNAEALKQIATNLESRRCKVLLYELPYPVNLGDTYFAATARLLMHSTYPDPQKWLNLESEGQQLRWIDANHMNERSAIIVAREIDKQIR